MKTTLEVSDLFRGAYLLASGGELARVRMRKQGRALVLFSIIGRNLERLDSDYRAGRALVNPVQLKESLNHLRDVMYARLRRTAPALAGGRERARYGSSKNPDRSDQAWR